MTTYTQIRDSVLRLLGDAAGATYDDELLYDGVCEAHEAILRWVPKPSVALISSSGSDGYFELPSDVYEIISIMDTSNYQILQRANLISKTTRGDLPANMYNDWLEFPFGYISLSNEVDDDQIKVFYYATWNKPANFSDYSFVIEVPSYAHRGLLFYAASYILMPEAKSSAGIRQYNLRIDSGTPEDNPVRDVSLLYLNRFYNEMKLMPPLPALGNK